MNKRQIKAILFDLDGTLLYTLEDIKAAINVPLVNRGVEPISISECRRIVGNGLRNAVANSLLEKNYIADESEIDQALLELQTYYKNNPTKYCKPYGKINETLKKFNIPIGILSNKDDKIVKQIVPEVFDGANFDYVAGAKDGILKPRNNRVIEFCKQVGIQPEELLYVGDSEVDYKTAVNSESQILLVTWGYRDKEELMKLNVPMVDTVEELWRYINEN